MCIKFRPSKLNIKQR